MSRWVMPNVSLARLLIAILTPVTMLATAMPASAVEDEIIVLPGASSAEGIAVGRGSTFYAGDLLKGDIYRGDLQRHTAALFIDAPSGRMAAGMKVDPRGDLLFVAGALTGQGYVYDTATGAPLAVYQLANPAAGTFINDVAVTGDGAWFTDSVQPRLYFVPVSPTRSFGASGTLTLTGPAADISGPFNLNGIAATPNGDRLIVGHSANGKLYTVDPRTGASAEIANVSVPNVDGILFEAGRLWAVQNFNNQIVEIRLSPDLTSGVVEEVITSSRFQVPTTVARHGSDLVAVNGKFDTGFPPTAAQYEAVIVRR
jgi:sugar lactone lactonase YvrE